MRRIPIKRNRRRFLKQAGLITGAGVLLAMAPRPGPLTNENAAAPPSRQGRGYRLTPHIRNYYQKAGL